MQKSLPQEHINTLMKQKVIIDAYERFNEQNGGQLAPAAKKISDETLQILNNLVEAGYDLVKGGWQYATDQEVSEKMSQPIYDLYNALQKKP